MELVSPAGNIEKLAYAWEYGADAVYVGLKDFSLRVKADNFREAEYVEIERLKKDYAGRGAPKRLFCALNITFHNDDLRAFLAEADYFRHYPIDAFIIQDLGLVNLLGREFPGVPLHLSTQANCVNHEAVRMYRDIGFRRIVLGREASLGEIAEIKDAVPDMEIECFAHGAMCIAYSGRCLMSAYLAGRSANSGFCSHSCRWEYRLMTRAATGGAEPQAGLPESHEFALEERERPGEYFPVVEGDGFTELFSSKDLCMIDHLDKMKKAGIDALKIEGRMKSLYYTALVTRAYRKRMDAVEGRITDAEARPFADELHNVSHREFATGFYFSGEEANKTTRGEASSPYLLAGTIGKKIAGTTGDFEFVSMNKIVAGEPLEFIGPNLCSIEDRDYELIDPENGEPRSWISHGHPCLIRTKSPIAERFIVRVRDNRKPREGKVARHRDS
jgi:U32 family peptidase